MKCSQGIGSGGHTKGGVVVEVKKIKINEGERNNQAETKDKDRTEG